MSDQFWQAKLADLETQGLKRELRLVEGVDFSSNDFLSLSGHPGIARAGLEVLQLDGSSASASRLVTGNTPLHEAVESDLARFVNKPNALLFATGYMTNVGVLSALSCDRAVTILADKLCHASIIDGCRVGAGELKRFAHRDYDQLERMLGELDPATPKVIVSESIFSMDGDAADLKRLAELKKAHNAVLVIDEAHAFGLFGESLAGLCQAQGVTDEVDIIVGTLGKAAGCYGAFAASSESMREFLINHARSFIYSTAPPPAQLGAIQGALRVMRGSTAKAKRVQRTAEVLRDALRDAGFDCMDSSSQIVPVLIGDNDKAVALAQALRDCGFIVFAMRTPTVPPNTARLRLAVNAAHTQRTVTQFVEVLSDCQRQLANS